MKSDDELKQLARDIHAGHVFTSNHVPFPMETGPDEAWASDLRMIFMPLALSDQKALDEMVALDVRMFYEYLNKAGPWNINGYPQFMSMGIVTGEEWPKLQTYLRALAASDPLAGM